MGVARHIVAAFRVAQQEHPLPRHEHIIEERQRVHFLETRPQGMVKGGAVEVETFAAEEFQPRRIAGQGESKGSAPRRPGGQRVGTGGIDGDFVGDGQRRQQPRPVDDEAGVRFPDHRQRNVHIVGQRRRRGMAGRGRGLGRPVALQIDQRMRQHQIVFADELIVVLNVLPELRPILGEIVPGGGHGHKADIQEVRGAPHHPAAQLRPVAHHPAAGGQVFRRLGGDERQPHRVAGGGRGVGHFGAQFRVVLAVVQPGQRAHPVAQPRVGGGVFYQLAAQIEGRRAFPQPLDILRPVSGRHRCTSPPGFAAARRFRNAARPICRPLSVIQAGIARRRGTARNRPGGRS